MKSWRIWIFGWSRAFKWTLGNILNEIREAYQLSYILYWCAGDDVNSSGTVKYRLAPTPENLVRIILLYRWSALMPSQTPVSIEK